MPININNIINSRGTYSEGLGEKHDKCYTKTVDQFGKEMDFVIEQAHPDTIACLKEYRARVLGKMMQQTSEVQEHPMMKESLHKETEIFVRQSNISGLRKDTVNYMSIQDAANDDNFTQDA